MGNLFSSEQYTPKYEVKDYNKRRPGKDIYKIHRNKVYWRGELVEGADGATFDDMGNGYGKDKKYIFYQAFKMSTHNPRYFKQFSRGYSRDAVNVYFRGVPILEADPETFSVDGDTCIAKDLHNQYKNGKKIRKKRQKSRKVDRRKHKSRKRRNQ